MMIIENGWTEANVDDRAVNLFHAACRSLGRGDIRWVAWSTVVLANARDRRPVLRLRDLRDACVEAARQNPSRRRLPLSTLGDLRQFVEAR
jgi:hypothetical protein